MQIRPHSAVQSNQHSRIYANQQFGYFYILSQQGKEIKVNKQGDLAPKFVDNFTGFVNFKQRKNESLKDKSLMYSQPNLKYKKQENAIHPKGSKFLGYAQYPYNLRSQLPQFLQEETFKQSYQVRNMKNPLKKSALTNNIRHSTNIQNKKTNSERKEIKSKTSQNPCETFVSFDQKGQSYMNSSNRLSQGNAKQTNQMQKSLVMDASAKYCTMQRFKSPNCRSASSFCSTNASNQFVRVSQSKQSYFSQSLFNIEKTQTPNFIYQNSPQQMFSSIRSDPSSAYPFNKASIKSKCYKSSCQYQEYIPKRRYKKQQHEDNTVSINAYQNQLQLEKKQSQIVLKLKDSLKIYQPVPIQKQKNNEQQNNKKNNKDKLKTNPSQESNKPKK